MDECDVEFTKHTFYEDNNLKFFKMVANISELMIELINKKLLIFKRFHMDFKEIKCPPQWWQKHEYMFPIVMANVNIRHHFPMDGIHP
jgi:hypothetical protein